jgi:hypothetical protein
VDNGLLYCIGGVDAYQGEPTEQRADLPTVISQTVGHGEAQVSRAPGSTVVSFHCKEGKAFQGCITK